MIFSAITAAIGGAISAALGGGFFASLVTFVLKAAVGLAINYLLSKSMEQDPVDFSINGQLQAGGDIPRSFLLGFSATAGSLVYVNTFGITDKRPNNWLVQVIALSDWPLKDLTANIYINGEKCTIDYASGPRIIQGYDVGYGVDEYTQDDIPKVCVKFYDGTQTTADSYLTAAFGADDHSWDVNRVGKGVAYVIVTCEIEEDLFTGFPAFRFETTGAALYDITKDSTNGGSGTHRWSDMSTWGGDGDDFPAVQAYNIMRGLYWDSKWFYGLQNLNAIRLPSANWIAAVNKCRNSITGPSGAQPEFRSGGEIAVGAEIGDTIETLMTTCMGRICETGGTYKIYVGPPGASVASFTDEDILASREQSFKPFKVLSDSITGMTARYPSPAEAWNVKVAPPVHRSDLEALVGGRRIILDGSLDLVPYADQVQRLMKAAILEGQRARRHTFAFGPEFYGLEAGDVITWTSVRNGYAAKLFRVDGVMELNGLDIIIDITEVDHTDYDWNFAIDYRTPVDGPISIIRPAPQAITDWNAAPSYIADDDGFARRPAILLSWQADIKDVKAVQWEVRLAASGVVIYRGRTDQWQLGSILISQGLVPLTNYEVRGKYIPNSDRITLWSGWLAVQTLDTRLTGDDILAGAIGELQLADRAVTNLKIALLALDETLIQNNAIISRTIASLAVTEAKVAANAISVDKIVNGAIVSGKIADNAVLEAKLADNAVTVNKILNGAIVEGKLATNAVTEGKILAGAVTSAKIFDGAVTSLKLLDGAVLEAKLATNAVTVNKIAADAVTAAKLADLAVGTEHLQALAVTEAKVASNAITVNKIAADAVTEGKVASNAITEAKIAVDAVTNLKLADNAVTETKILNNSISTGKLQANSVTASIIAADAVTSVKIQAGSVTSDKVAANAILAKNILISDFENVVQNGNFSTGNFTGWSTPPSGWLIFSKGQVAVEPYTTAPAAYMLRINDPPADGLWINEGSDPSNRRQTFAGEQWYASVDVASFGAYTVNTVVFYIYWVKSDGSVTAVALLVPAGITDVWQTISNVFTAPADTVALYARLYCVGTVGGHTGYTFITNVTLRRMTAGSLIVDGTITASKIMAGTITSTEIAAGTIVAADIAAGTITGTQIAADAITSAKIAANTITAADIAANTITASQIAAGTITTTQIAAGTITATNIAAGTITGDKIAANTIGADRIVANSITARELLLTNFENLVPNGDFATGTPAGFFSSPAVAVHPRSSLLFQPNCPTAYAAWMDRAVTVAFYSHGSIVNSDPVGGFAVAPGEEYWMSLDVGATVAPTGTWRYYMNFRHADGTASVSAPLDIAATMSGLAWQTIGQSVVVPAGAARAQVYVIRTGAASGGHLGLTNMRVSRRNSANLIVDGAITTNKLEANSVTSIKIAAATIVAADIAANTITASQIAASTITANELAANSITAADMVAGTITAAQIASSTITATQMAAGSIGVSELAANSVTAAAIAAGTITATEIAAGAITATQLGTGSVTAIKILAGSITAEKLTVASAVITDTIQIGDTIISTDKIINNAISAAASGYTAAASSITSSLTIKQTATVSNPNGDPCMIIAECIIDLSTTGGNSIDPATVYVRLYRGGTQLREHYVFSWGSNTIRVSLPLSYRDATPGTGSITYTIQAFIDTGSTTTATPTISQSLVYAQVLKK